MEEKDIDDDYNTLRGESPNTPDQIWKDVKKEYSNDEYINELVELISERQ